MTEEALSRIAATDGTQFKDIGVVNHKVQQIVVSMVTEGQGDATHFTYHEDGYAHVKVVYPSGKPKVMDKISGPELKDFRGFLGSHRHTLPSELRQIPAPKFDFNHYTTTTLLDTREPERNDVGMTYQVFIVEPDYPVNKILEPVSAKERNIHFDLITHTTPWIGIAYWAVENEIELPRASENFEFQTDV